MREGVIPPWPLRLCGDLRDGNKRSPVADRESGQEPQVLYYGAGCPAIADDHPVIPRMGTPKMHMTLRSRVIGRMPKLEARGTERRGADREVFGETIERSKRQSDRLHSSGLAAPPRA